MAESVIETLAGIAAWEGPYPADMQERAVQALESGKVLFFPDLPFRLRAEEEIFLDPAIADGSRKNISFDPASSRVAATSLQGEKARALGAMLDRFGRAAEALVRGLFPAYARDLVRARTSYRPVEISGRPTSPRHDDRRLHVDAFPTRPLHGWRILRVFSNIAPDGAVRQWEVGEPFPDLARRFFPRLGRPWPGTAALLAALGLTKGRRSLYDFYMLRLHDGMKLDEAYQQNVPRHPLAFPPGTSWMVFTDQASHAVKGGRFALEQTFHLPVTSLHHPERAPLRVLEALAGRPLV
jgi:hypothetical protein